SLETGLPSGERDQVLQQQPQLYVEVSPDALVLIILESRQGITPFGGNLRQSQVRASQLGTERVHSHENFRDLLVGERALQDIHAVDILSDATQPGQPLRIFFVTWVLKAGHTRFFENLSISIGTEYLAYPYPVWKPRQLIGGNNKGHLLKTLLQLV